MEPGDAWGLLSLYARHRDESAFAELVRRYVDLVYSAALRRVGDRQLAEDVTQGVFVILAKKAKSLRPSGPLSAWLLTTVRYAAANAIRMERRRQHHEGAAAAGVRPEILAGAGACSSNPSDVLVWQELAARLDDAVLALPASDRRAVLLRFFEDRPIRDVALALNVTEGAAKQRVSRALEKLRARLGRRGSSDLEAIGPAGLATLLAAHAVRAAPSGLTAHCVAAATLGAAGGGIAGITIAKGALKMMAWTKAKVAAAVLAVAVVGGATGAIGIRSALARGPSGATPAVATVAPTLAAAAAPAAGKPDAASKDEPTKLKRKDNMGIIGVADAPPVVVSTTPKAGSDDVDAATTTEIKVTFSKDMEPGSFSWVQYGKDTFPKLNGKAKFQDDKRTCVLPVKLEAGHPYVIWLNKAPYNNFVDTDGNKAVPYLLVFETKP